MTTCKYCYVALFVDQCELIFGSEYDAPADCGD